MIIWLASYPKSGNTWLRSLLSSYFFSKNGEFHFGLLKNIDQFPSINYFKNDKDLYLKPESTSEKWITKQTEINKDKKLRLFKTHSAMCKINGNRFTDPQNTLGAIYIVRDPRNLVTSLANHYQINTSEAFTFMQNEKKALVTKKENRFLGFNALFSWSIHIDSWINYKDFPILIVRYEDLQSKTFDTLKKVINFIQDLTPNKKVFDREKAKKTIISCGFNKLKNMENTYGFPEAMVKKNNTGKVKFFNLGQENDYKKILDKKVLDQINKTYKEKLLKFNYEI